MDLFLFYAFAALTVGASFFVIAQRNPMHSVMLLIAAFLGLAGLYVLLDAPFTAVTQIIVYAGAIMVLFLFVVMLLNAPREDAPVADRRLPLLSTGPRRMAGVLSVAFLAEILWAFSRVPSVAINDTPGVAERVSNVATIGHEIFTTYTFAFEATSVLILAAMVGAVVLARKNL